MTKKGEFDGRGPSVAEAEKEWERKIDGTEGSKTRVELRAERQEDHQHRLVKMEIVASIIENSPDLATLPGIDNGWLDGERRTFRQKTVDALKYFIKDRKMASFPVEDGATQENLGLRSIIEYYHKTKKIILDAILKKIEQELTQTWEIDIEGEEEKWGLAADNLLKEFADSMSATRKFKIDELEKAIEKKVESLT